MQWLSEVLMALAEEYKMEMSETRVAMWANMLSKYTEAQVKQAVIGHMSDTEAGKWAPKVSDIIRQIEGTREDRKDAGVVAWRVMMENLNSYNSVVFDDPAIHYAVAVVFGSWHDVGMMYEKDQPFRKKDFIDAYASYKDGMAYPPRMIGRMEIGAATGESVYSIDYVGDQQKAIEVEQGGRAGGMKPISTIDYKAIIDDSAKV